MDKNETESGIICLKPFYAMDFFYTKVYSCICPDWIKYDIGDISKNNIAEIWNGDNARYIRRKMYNGEWQDICNPICPFIIEYKRNKKLILFSQLNQFDFLTPSLVEEIMNRKDCLESPPTLFKLDNSKTCNLSCIMCATQKINDDPELLKKTAGDIFNYLPTTKKVILTGNGDPFVRPDTRDLLIDYKKKNLDLKFDIITNALLLPKYWEQIKHNNFGSLLISIDASDKETYEKIRYGGRWKDLLCSLALVRKNKNRFESITLNMTVMRSNYKKITDFINFAESYGFNVSFQKIRGNFNNQNIFEMEDTAALEELREIIINEQSKKRGVYVYWGDLLEFIQAVPV